MVVKGLFMDEENLISKKDVLERTGISYGQFYRWKRKGLIPESWFIRKSTFTGQETFLPRTKVIERIEKIQSLKDEHSLDELAQVLAPEVGVRDFSEQEVAQMGWISSEVRAFYEGFHRAEGGYSFHDVLFLTVVEKLRQALDDEELALALSTLLEQQDLLQSGQEFRWTLVVGRKTSGRILTKTKHPPSICFCCLIDRRCSFDPQTEIVTEIELHPVLEEIKLKVSQLA